MAEEGRSRRKANCHPLAVVRWVVPRKSESLPREHGGGSPTEKRCRQSAEGQWIRRQLRRIFRHRQRLFFGEHAVRTVCTGRSAIVNCAPGRRFWRRSVSLGFLAPIVSVQCGLCPNVKSAHAGPPPGGGLNRIPFPLWWSLERGQDTSGVRRRNWGSRSRREAVAARHICLSGHNGAPPPPTHTLIFRSRSLLGSPLDGWGPSHAATPLSEGLLCADWGRPRRPHLSSSHHPTPPAR